MAVKVREIDNLEESRGKKLALNNCAIVTGEPLAEDNGIMDNA